MSPPPFGSITGNYGATSPKPRLCDAGAAAGRVLQLVDVRADGRRTFFSDPMSRIGLELRFGLSWQIVPNALGRMLSDKDAAKSKRVMNVMLQMDKLDLKRLQQAYDGE
ncbi:MAG: hypothetical protein AUH43_01340 [Acidobacteria bacterium 13_1_40CM_65_14]|nr:MAG: hypothetical protein AUH43_01340 [Acidobacteria bacterium 13_1_40CM_65_14]